MPQIRTSLAGMKRQIWRKNLHGFFTVNGLGRAITDKEVRRVVNYAIANGYEWAEDIEDYEVDVLLGLKQEFEAECLYANGDFKKGQVYQIEYVKNSPQQGEPYRICLNKEKGIYIYMSVGIFGDDKHVAIFKIKK
ncbi:MAG: hypothetical protein IJS13_07005 [Paludibacteraceae bacterium]|nr:hypothetical protein [Paludibacteraceae bacterium]